MKAKQVFEALKDVLKPRDEEDIKSHFTKILGKEVGEWLFKFQKNIKLHDFVLVPEKPHKKAFAEFEILGVNTKKIKSGWYNILVSGDKKIKIMPPESTFYSSLINVNNYDEFYQTIFDWISGENSEWEMQLDKLTNQVFPDLE